MMMDKIKLWVQKWWFLASSVALTILYVFFERRGRTIKELQVEAQKQQLAQELQSIRLQSERSQEDYEKAMERYNNLKRNHCDLLTKLGLLPGKEPNHPE